MSADPDLDAVLLVEPRHFWMLHAAKTRYRRKNPLSAGLGPIKPSRLQQPLLDHENIWVHTLKDLKDAHERMDRAFWIAEALNQLVSASSAIRRQAIYRMLSAQPDLQTALKAVKKNWPKSRPATASPPRIARRK
jgi:hypothetical protein